MTTINAQTIDLARNPLSVTQAAQQQWFKRPNDQKFESLEELYLKLEDRRMRSSEFMSDIIDVEWKTSYGEQSRLPLLTMATKVELDNGRKYTMEVTPTNFAFGQTVSKLGAPAAFLRTKLAARPDLVSNVLNHLVRYQEIEPIKIMTLDEPSVGLPMLSAVTSRTYGRIWDADVVAAAAKIIDGTNGEFFSPLDWTRQKRALFASDRDVFMFFIDGGSIVDGGGERDQLNRGWFMWNSEVGRTTFGIATFLFRAVCGNFGIWGAEDVRMLKIRHTSGGPERFVTQAIPAIQDYVRTSARPLEAAIRAAKRAELPAKNEDFITYFRQRGFTLTEINMARQFAEQEEGECKSVWDMYNGFTIIARSKAFIDAKVELETRAGNLMKQFLDE